MCVRRSPESTVIVLLPQWLQAIFNLTKTLEIRGMACRHLIGQRIFLCESGSSRVFGSAVVSEVVGPISKNDWCMLRAAHCVPGPPLYAHSYGWRLSNVTRFQRPIVIHRKRGSIGIQKGPGWNHP